MLIKTYGLPRTMPPAHIFTAKTKKALTRGCADHKQLKIRHIITYIHSQKGHFHLIVNFAYDLDLRS